MNEAVSLEGQPSEPRSIIEAFDPSTGALGGDTGGPFWKAIERAHELGFRGGGHRVAIIDTMCDLSMPYLKSRVDRVWSDGECDDLSTAPLEHGTAVALLISLIAPEARLDVYPAVASKFPQTDRVIRAISAAAHSEAPTLNLSLGVAREFVRHRNIEEDPGQAEILDNPHRWLAAVSPDVENCRLCAAARAAASTKMLFAAAGNDPSMVCCPARAEGVVAIGFQRSIRETAALPDGSIVENASATGTGAQSSTWDIGLDEFNGILGTSFASPLYAGVGALGLSAVELNGYLASTRWGTLAQQMHFMLRKGVGGREMVEAVRGLYERSLAWLPHAHCETSIRLRPDLSHTDPQKCWTCGIFATDKLVNAGLFLAETGNIDDALGLLEAACELAPWSSDAFSCAGAAYRRAGRLEAAAACYERAIAMRPNFSVYTDALARVQNEIAHSGRDVPRTF